MKKNRKQIQDEWFDNLPSYVQERVRQYPPDGKYRLKETGQIVSIYSYEDNGVASNTCKIIALGKDSGGMHTEDRLVFGIEYSSLEPILIN